MDTGDQIQFEQSDSGSTNTTDMMSTITSDDEFMNEMIKIKKILKVDDVDELKDKQSELLRDKIINVLKYVMAQIEAEEAPTEETSIGGGKKKKGRKQKGGTPMDMNRITNTYGVLNTTKDPYNQILDSPDVHVALNMHKAFTAGNSSGFSSIAGLPAAEVNSMLPSLGTSQAGGASKKTKKRK